MTKVERSYAVDLFRGLTIVAMILVNNPGTWSYLYAPLAHAEWHGWTSTDLIFPFFLIIIGVAIQLSFGMGSKSSLARSEQLKEVFIRSLKLYGLGLFLTLFYYQFHNPDYSWINDRLLDVRLFGVLQRIAFVYCFSALIFLYFSQKQQIFAFIGLLLGYWITMMWIPYPLPDGTTTMGQLEPGNNMAAFIDHHIIGPAHVYLSSTKPFASDPEGLLSTLPAIASCVGGFFIASLLQKPVRERIRLLILTGMAAVVVAYVLAIWIPFNKPLWTPSYVFLAHGLASLVLAAATYVTEVKHIRVGTKAFVVFGMNAIALFMLSGIFARILLMIRVGDQSLKSWIYDYFELVPVSAETQSLLYAVVFLIFMYIPLYWMYQKRIFWKV